MGTNRWTLFKLSPAREMGGSCANCKKLSAVLDGLEMRNKVDGLESVG